MAQTERTPKANSFPDNSPITTLRNNIAVGNTINASDINSLINLTNAWQGHFHTYDDAYQLATYGNNGDRGNYYEDKNTGAIQPNGLSQLYMPPSTVASAGEITTLTHNELRGAIRGFGNHSHYIADRTA